MKVDVFVFKIKLVLVFLLFQIRLCKAVKSLERKNTITNTLFLRSGNILISHGVTLELLDANLEPIKQVKVGEEQLTHGFMSKENGVTVLQEIYKERGQELGNGASVGDFSGTNATENYLNSVHGNECTQAVVLVCHQGSRNPCSIVTIYEDNNITLSQIHDKIEEFSTTESQLFVFERTFDSYDLLFAKSEDLDESNSKRPKIVASYDAKLIFGNDVWSLSNVNNTSISRLMGGFRLDILYAFQTSSGVFFVVKSSSRVHSIGQPFYAFLHASHTGDLVEMPFTPNEPNLTYVDAFTLAKSVNDSTVYLLYKTPSGKSRFYSIDLAELELEKQYAIDGKLLLNMYKRHNVNNNYVEQMYLSFLYHGMRFHIA